MTVRPVTVCCIVEGHGEVAAAPILVRRVAAEFFSVVVDVPKPHRLPRSQMLDAAELRRATRLQSIRAGDRGGVLVIADSDDDPWPGLAEQLRGGVDAEAAPRCGIVIAVREYEAWFLASAESLRHHRSVRDDASWSGDPEAPRGAKEKMRRLMVEKYRETVHQPAFTARMDLRAARAGSPSFARLVDDIRVLLERG